MQGTTEPGNLAMQWLPFRFTRLHRANGILVTSEGGDYILLDPQDFRRLVSKRIEKSEALYQDLVARGIIASTGSQIEQVAAQYRSRKAFLRGGPSLHIFVVTLSCDHSCPYCQVSRAVEVADRFTMSDENAVHAVNRLFDSPSRHLTVEFQGGEPLLAFSKIKRIVELIEARNILEKREIRFVIASTGHLLNPEILEFMKTHKILFSTSLDGPEWLHNTNRPKRTKDSFRRSVDAIAMARGYLGDSAVAALTTITRASLSAPREIVDTYVELGFPSIFLRPLSPYGFAVKSRSKIGYSIDEFMQFYSNALQYIIDLNLRGVHIEESYTALLLKLILTPFSHNYVDLRSPSGAGLGALVYNYDGLVYVSDEARMLAEMNDQSFCAGHVSTPYNDLLQSEAMRAVLSAGVAESLPGCAECAFLPFCGADPIHAYASQRDPIGHRPTSNFCSKQTFLFETIFELLERRDPKIYSVLLAWARGKTATEIPVPGYLA